MCKHVLFPLSFVFNIRTIRLYLLQTFLVDLHGHLRGNLGSFLITLNAHQRYELKLTLFYFFKCLFYLLIYLAVPGLSCSTWDFQSSLQHSGALVAACELFVVECGLWFQDQRLVWAHCIKNSQS